MSGLPPTLLDEPTNILVRGPSRGLADRAGYAIATAARADIVVMEIQEEGDSESGPGPWEPHVRAEQRFIVRAPRADALAAGGGSAVPWPIVRSDRPDLVVTDLTAFLTQPEVSSRLLRALLPPGRPLTVLVANGAPAARTFPADAHVTGHLLNVQKRLSHRTIFTSDETPRPDYLAFDYDFVVVASEHRPLRLRCQRAPLGRPVTPGDEFVLPDERPGDERTEDGAAPLRAGPPAARRGRDARGHTGPRAGHRPFDPESSRH